MTGRFDVLTAMLLKIHIFSEQLLTTTLKKEAKKSF
jgi:hypothetical protein